MISIGSCVASVCQQPGTGGKSPSLVTGAPVIATVSLSPLAWHDVAATPHVGDCRCGADADRRAACPAKELCCELRRCGPPLR